MLLSIIIPVFNEEKTILKILNQIENQKYIKKQILLVDDNSTDSSLIRIKKFKFKSKHKIITHKNNQGKGKCIISAKKYIKGDIIIIQDADLEYSPNDYKKILQVFKNKKIYAVYGSRVLNKNRYGDKNFTSTFRIFANHMLTIFSNIINNQQLTDAHTCYKAFRKNVFKRIKLYENGFSFCPEITTKLSNLKISIKEVPIRYNGRTFEDGKKIKIIDGFLALITIVKYKFYKRT